MWLNVLCAGFETVIVNYGTDIPSLKGTHKRYLYGPGSILVAHSAEEHINVTDLSAAVDGYQRLITQILKRPSGKSNNIEVDHRY